MRTSPIPTTHLALEERWLGAAAAIAGIMIAIFFAVIALVGQPGGPSTHGGVQPIPAPALVAGGNSG